MVCVCVFINVAQKHSLCVMVCGSFNEEIYNFEERDIIILSSV